MHAHNYTHACTLTHTYTTLDVTTLDHRQTTSLSLKILLSNGNKHTACRRKCVAHTQGVSEAVSSHTVAGGQKDICKAANRFATTVTVLLLLFATDLSKTDLLLGENSG